MKSIITSAVMLALLVVACKSNDVQDTTPALPDVTVCSLRKISYTNHATLSAIEFSYNTTKRLVKVNRIALKSANNQVDSLEYNNKGLLSKIYTLGQNTKKPVSTLTFEYDANGRLLSMTRSNSEYKDAFVFNQNNQASKIESGYKGDLISQNDIYTFEYDKSGNVSKMQVNVTAQIPGFGKINHSYYVYENLLIDDKSNLGNTSADVANYFFFKGDPERMSLKNNALQTRMADKVDVSYEPTGSKATVSYLIHSHKYMYNTYGLPVKDTDEISESGSATTIKTVVAEMTYLCQ